MKYKIMKFLKEKKDLLIFIGILIIVFVSVIAISNYAINNSDSVPAINDDIEDSEPTETPSTDEVEYKFISPVMGDYIVARTFYDSTYATKDLETALITFDNVIYESTGVSYKLEDDQTFNVQSIYPGTVMNIINDENKGYTISIKHDDGVISRYSSLSKVNVNIGDTIAENQTIGLSGTQSYDSLAGNHVHLEVINNNVFLDPQKLIGKTIEEVIELK